MPIQYEHTRSETEQGPALPQIISDFYRQQQFDTIRRLLNPQISDLAASFQPPGEKALAAGATAGLGGIIKAVPGTGKPKTPEELVRVFSKNVLGEIKGKTTQRTISATAIAAEALLAAEKDPEILALARELRKLERLQAKEGLKIQTSAYVPGAPDTTFQRTFDLTGQETVLQKEIEDKLTLRAKQAILKDLEDALAKVEKAQEAAKRAKFSIVPSGKPPSEPPKPKK